jgi:hypothetical protein
MSWSSLDGEFQCEVASKGVEGVEWVRVTLSLEKVRQVWSVNWEGVVDVGLERRDSKEKTSRISYSTSAC